MEIPDAYAEYIRERHEREQSDKIATLIMPVSEMAALWHVIADTVDSTNGKMPTQVKRKWESILRSLARAIEEAA